MAPETTEGYQPYIHPLGLEGTVGRAALRLILRDFRTEGLDEQKKMLEKIIGEVQALYPGAGITLTVTESYRNMRNALEEWPEVTERLWRAAEKAGTGPFWRPIRGGTDGARLTAMGLPTPNSFTGSCSHHSLTEWLSVDALAASAATLVWLVRTDG
jgi:tripeptide aminopeptidase